MRVLKVKDALVKVKRPVKIPQSEYLPFGSYPVIDQGKSIIAGYTNDIESVIFSPLLVALLLPQGAFDLTEYVEAVRLHLHPKASSKSLL